MKLLVATRNSGKLREIRALLEPPAIEVIGLADLDDAPEIEEDAETFLGNARKKAWCLANRTCLPVLADDSGLTVDALGGKPGVRSARYSGASASDADNNRKLLADLTDVPLHLRRAAFVCAMVLAVPGRGEFTAEGRLEGTVLDSPRGSGGFGYDPLFLVAGTRQTLAEMDLETKNSLSHRGRALSELLPKLLRALAA